MATIGKHGVLPQEQSEIPKPGFQSLLSIHLQYSITPKKHFHGSRYASQHRQLK